MKKVIVTGATGMIGATMISQLLEDGIKVFAIVRPNSKKISNLKHREGLTIIECDINNLLSLVDVVDNDCDAFYHFAWDGTYGDSRNDIMLQENNIRNTLEAVELAKKTGCGVFVGAGSQAEFGYVDGVISDKVEKKPVTGYGVAKLVANKMSAMLCNQYGIRHCWGRIISTYGPMDNEYTMIMSSVIGMINGDRMSFTPGEQLWDYVYSEDCSKAFYLIGKYGVNGKSYTIGSGSSKLLKDYIVEMRDAINPSLEVGIGERPYYPNQVMRLEADISELIKDTGFMPAVSFNDGIKKTVEWYKGKVN